MTERWWRRWAVALQVLGVALAAGCGGGEGGGKGGGGKTIPEGFIVKGCANADDCAPMPCKVAACDSSTQQCSYTDLSCGDSLNFCMVSVCDPSTGGGTCVSQPNTDGTACLTDDDTSGVCQSGTCNAVPTCYDPTLTEAAIACASADQSVQQASNDPNSFFGAAAVVSSYACAPNEAGPELAFQFVAPDDEDVTVALKLIKDDASDAVQTSIDLDLIVLADGCVGSAACMNPMVGSAYAGVTAGTSDEHVTFHASAGTTYYFVVDGKDMNQVGDFQLEVEACGACQPKDGTRLSCNMSMPVEAMTSTGAALLTNYACGTSSTSVTAPGNEIPFYFRSPSDPNASTYKVTATLIGASGPYTMLALPTNYDGACDPTGCLASATGSAGDNTLSWTLSYTDFDDTFARNWLVIDTPADGDVSFGLQLGCTASCDFGSQFDCAVNEKKVTSTTIGAAALVGSWGPGATGCGGLNGLVGPETAIEFAPDIVVDSVYEVQLSSNTSGVELSVIVLDAGTGNDPSCDPTYACVTETPVTGGGRSGTATTSNGATAGVTFTAHKGHTYLIAVDGVDPAGADFTAKLVGQTAGSGCM